MLARVDVRSRPDDQFVENTEGPKGVFDPYWLLCGIEPARNLDKRAALFNDPSPISPKFGDGLLNGLGAGEGLEDFAISEGSGPSPPRPLLNPPGENRDGTVPARARRVCGRLSGVGRCEKSGKPSVGDSGMFSRRGVDPPLVGGPHTLRLFTGRPSCACISRCLCEVLSAMFHPRDPVSVTSWKIICWHHCRVVHAMENQPPIVCSRPSCLQNLNLLKVRMVILKDFHLTPRSWEKYLLLKILNVVDNPSKDDRISKMTL